MNDSTFALVGVAALAVLLVLCLAIGLGLRSLSRAMSRPAVEAPALPSDAERYEIGKAYVGLVPAPDATGLKLSDLDRRVAAAAESREDADRDLARLRADLERVSAKLAAAAPPREGHDHQ